MAKRSRKYQEAIKLIDRTKRYTVEEAIELAKKTNKMCIRDSFRPDDQRRSLFNRRLSPRLCLDFDYSRRYVADIVDMAVFQTFHWRSKTRQLEMCIRDRASDWSPSVKKRFPTTKTNA